MQDRRHDIVEAGLAVLREHGYTGFTQPRIAARVGLRQSHLTYYYPTRLDLLEAVGRTAITSISNFSAGDRQLVIVVRAGDVIEISATLVRVGTALLGPRGA